MSVVARTRLAESKTKPRSSSVPLFPSEMYPMQEANHFQSTAIADLFEDPTLGVRRANGHTGTDLYDAEDVPGHVYFIHRGQVRVYQVNPDCEQCPVEILGPGDWLGISA